MRGGIGCEGRERMLGEGGEGEDVKGGREIVRRRKRVVGGREERWVVGHG